MKFVLLLSGIAFMVMSQVVAQSEKIMQNSINEVKNQYAPDGRVALFQITGDNAGILTGKTNLPEAKADLLSRLKNGGIAFEDQIELLPSALLNGKVNGVVRISVANIRSKPAHSAEMSTQALLGTSLKVWDKEGDWYLVQTPDNYLGWMDAGGFKLMDSQQFENWAKLKKLIVVTPYTFSYQKPAEDALPVSDLVAGGIVSVKEELKDYFLVAYPEGKTAYVARKDAKLYSEWLSGISISEESLVTTALKMMGIPYLWGGTSYKGMDCSGFTKMVYFLNGKVLARDASQQVHTGEPIAGTGYGNFRKGDLLFFGTPASEGSAEKVTHVGMWIGDNRFIHASGQIRIGSVDPSSLDYDGFNVSRFLRARRMLGVQNGIKQLK